MSSRSSCTQGSCGCGSYRSPWWVGKHTTIFGGHRVEIALVSGRACSIVEAMAEVSEAHIQQLQVQGLYLAKTGHRVPVDVSVHTLRMHPFGRDSRYDPLRPDDAPAYKPQASVMKMRAEGYKPRTKLKDPDLDAADPRRMVFTDKMMQ